MDQVHATGIVQFDVYDAEGRLRESRTVRNLVVTTGKNHMASRMVGVAQNVASHFAVGTSATAAQAADTALGAELTRVAFSAYTATTNVVTATASFGAGVGTGTWAEAGLLNAASVGTLVARTAFTGFAKAAGDTVNVTWTITFN